MLRLRPATAADAPLLRRWDQEPDIVRYVPHEGIDWERELVPTAWHESLIAELDGRPIGFVDIQDPAADPDRYWGDVGPGVRALDIWIGEAELRGRGHGAEMMRQAITRCFAPPAVRAILIDPLAENVRAIRFYERLGFVAVGRRWFDEDDCLVMRLDRPAAR